jgi:hypothetical protein
LVGGRLSKSNLTAEAQGTQRSRGEKKRKERGFLSTFLLLSPLLLLSLRDLCALCASAVE